MPKHMTDRVHPRTKRQTVVSAEELAKKWRIGINTTKLTLKATTQFGLRQALHFVLSVPASTAIFLTTKDTPTCTTQADRKPVQW